MIGTLRHRVTVQSDGTPVADGDGGWTQTPVILAYRIPAAVAPATSRDLERVVAETVQSMATHIVTLRYLPGVTTKHHLVFHDTADRTFAITGTHDPDERHRWLELACAEVVA